MSAPESFKIHNPLIDINATFIGQSDWLTEYPPGSGMHYYFSDNQWVLYQPQVPSSTTGLYTATQLQRLQQYTQLIQTQQSKFIQTYSYVNDHVSVSAFETYGGIYSPTMNRIYLAPFNQSTEWYYIDCNGPTVHTYTHGASVLNLPYVGGVYTPTLNRIYFAPFLQGSQSTWHYVDCTDGAIVGYPSVTPATSFLSYSGAVYDPTHDRVYFCPSGQSATTEWHYIDSEGVVQTYPNPHTLPGNAYVGGVYAPTLDRIYLVPGEQAPGTFWHYIDCSTNEIVPYLNTTSAVTQGYHGGVYAPTLNRIYFIPYNQSGQEIWHYIDCEDGAIVPYVHGATLSTPAYHYGTYSPLQNRIYMCPTITTGVSGTWHYIDCNDGSVQPYSIHPLSPSDSGYTGLIFCPTDGRIYLIPQNQTNKNRWHVLDSLSNAKVDLGYYGGPQYAYF
jgi:hypothetical protein